MNISCWKWANDGCLGTMVSLLIGLLYTSLQLPLDNCENKNSRNVCLSQIRENIFPQKFLLTQYSEQMGLLRDCAISVLWSNMHRNAYKLAGAFGLSDCDYATRLLSTVMVFFTTSRPWCLIVTLPSGLSTPNFQKKCIICSPVTQLIAQIIRFQYAPVVYDMTSFLCNKHSVTLRSSVINQTVILNKNWQSIKTLSIFN